MKRVVAVCFTFGWMLAVVSPAFAQRDAEIPIQFDFINPGARSLALAGAFIGLADDATAAATNPAGLVQLARPEISVEGRGWKFITDFVQGGRLSGTPTNMGIDTVSGPVFGETSERVGGLSYLSYVYPRGPWRVAAYRQEASRLKSSAQTEGAFFIDYDEFGVLTHFREFPSKVDRELDVINYGGSVAYRAGPISIGGGVHLSQIELNSNLTGYENPTNFFAAADYSRERFGSVQSADDVGVGFSGGLLVIPNRQVQFGVSFRHNPSVDFDGELDYPLFPELSGPYTGEFKVPDNFGVGVAVRPFEGLMVAFDLNRVTYSDLNGFLQKQIRFHPEESTLYTIDDATEFHLGAEYVVTGVSVLPAFRAGFWRESEHAVTYAGENELYLATASLAKDVTHFSFGGGVAPTPRFELNAGFDFSDRANTMSFSAIFRF
jgi:long-chain fatty acid transport protein